jgi:hypothetical protein
MRSPLRLGALGVASLLALTLACTGIAVHAGLPAPPGLTVDVGFFWSELAPYGAWIDLAPWGWVWAPGDVGPGWRPYTYGRWVFTDDGWTWVSYWNWGWGPFHYGRWLRHPAHGWVWMPGDAWAPAWVTWRHGPGWVGWAPLPPDARWDAGSGLLWSRRDLDGDAWSFVAEGRFVDPQLERHLASRLRRDELLAATRDITRYDSREPSAVSDRLPPAAISEASGHPVPRLRTVETTRPPETGPGAVDRDHVRIYRPSPKREPPAKRHRPPGGAP